jgi:hypothetical protein
MAVDVARLRATVEHLEAFERPSASEGERRAAEWIRAELEARGAVARVEQLFAEKLVTVPADTFPRWYARQETSPQVATVAVAGAGDRRPDRAQGPATPAPGWGR